MESPPGDTAWGTIARRRRTANVARSWRQLRGRLRGSTTCLASACRSTGWTGSARGGGRRAGARVARGIITTRMVAAAAAVVWVAAVAAAGWGARERERRAPRGTEPRLILLPRLRTSTSPAAACRPPGDPARCLQNAASACRTRRTSPPPPCRRRCCPRARRARRARPPAACHSRRRRTCLRRPRPRAEVTAGPHRRRMPAGEHRWGRRK
jgi:hypothetical protein